MIDFGFYNMDCMAGMGEFPDNYFDLAIVDPPYGKNIAMSGKLGDDGGADSRWNGKSNGYHRKGWDKKPNKKYWSELFRVSGCQIVWGGNYFTKYLPGTEGRLIWDKKASGNYSEGEEAWTSENKFRIYRYLWNGFRQEKGKEIRIHINQKPVELYRWILHNYAKAGWKILDTHVGSGSSLIACEREGFKYVGFEIDPDYYKAAKERIERERMQLTLALQ